MSPDIESKDIYNVIGLMSGTSLDGVDAAWLTTDGDRLNQSGETIFIPYSADDKGILMEAIDAALRWKGIGPRPNILAVAERIIDARHIEACEALIAQTGRRPDLVGFHGQTVYHRPATKHLQGLTVQIGDAHRLAYTLETPVVFDFRSNDVAQGGQGAPLAPGYHDALLPPGSDIYGVLNIGGVSNITIRAKDGTLLASDCGPGNGPLDSWISQNEAGEFDADGTISQEGHVDMEMLDSWMSRPFFDAPVPRSADRWDFDVTLNMKSANMTLADGAATLVAYMAHGVKDTLTGLTQRGAAYPQILVLCGGGRHNPVMHAALTEVCGCTCIAAETLHWSGDFLEAEAFAWLAVRHLKNKPLSWPGTTGVPFAISGGQLASP